MASLQGRHPLGCELPRYAAVTNERVSVAEVVEREVPKRIVLVLRNLNWEDIMPPHYFQHF